MSKVFVSYNRKSEALARSLADDVEALGHTVWLDQDLTGGQGLAGASERAQRS
jgi:hypothetical protein